MNFYEIVEKANRGDYHSKLPYPPWGSFGTGGEANRAARRAYDEDRCRLRDVFKDDLREMVEGELGKKLTKDQFQALFDHAWEDGHSSGYYEVAQVAHQLATLLKVFLP